MQHDYNIANGSGAAVRGDLNDVLEAIATGNSGATAPTVTFPYMRWFDTATNVLKVRNGANTAWVSVWPDITATYGGFGTASLKNTGISGDVVPVLNVANAKFIAGDENNTLTVGSLRDGAAEIAGEVGFRAKDAAANDEDYVKLRAIIDDPTNASEDGRLSVLTKIAGTEAARAHVGAGLYMEGATGGDPGAGKINATEVQVNGVALGAAIAGSVVKVQAKLLQVSTSLAGTIPFDNTTPQKTEGAQALAADPFTPAASANLLLIFYGFNGARGSSATHLIGALFQDNAADALSVMAQEHGSGPNGMVSLSGFHLMTAGTTSATTFKLRGGSEAGTAVVGGDSGGGKFNGKTAAAWIVIVEIKV